MEEKLTIDMYCMKMSELLTFCERELSIIDRFCDDTIRNYPIVAELRRLVKECREEMFKKSRLGWGPLLEASDKHRDKLYSGFRWALESKIPFGGEMAEAAEYLLRLVKSIKSIRNLNYSEETQVLNVLIKDLSTEESRQMIAIAGLDREVEALQKAQMDFWTLYNERQEIESAMLQKIPATKFKPKIIAAMRNLLSFAWVMRAQKPWTDFYYDTLKEIKTEKQAGRGVRKKRK